MHLCDSLDGVENVIMMSDGTRKWGHKYQTYDVRVPEGKTFIAGMREVACGDASTLFDCLKGVVNAIGSLGVKDLTSWVNEKIVSIKNTMSDRAAVQKKMNAMLEDVSTHVAPTVKDEWSEMKED